MIGSNTDRWGGNAGLKFILQLSRTPCMWRDACGGRTAVQRSCPKIPEITSEMRCY